MKNITEGYPEKEVSDIKMDKKNQELARWLFPEELMSVESVFEKYPKRELPADAMVTRIAPSPTGFMHIGGIYMALISERFAHQTDGVYYLRIEDTDKKREVKGARKIITKALHDFGLDPDEGEDTDGVEHGSYGPYCQSEREEIYKTFIKHLVEGGKAYPCFCSEEELEEMRKMQEDLKVRPGYYGVWAKCRDKKSEDVNKMLDENKPYVVRFRSEGNSEKTFTHNDLLKGEIELPENDLDAVIMKSDDLPTYHLAHAVDDHIMGTTHVLRGDEWVSSIPLHYELFNALGFDILKYGHIAPINKIDEKGNKRKLSKRKDPEANAVFYQEKGYPESAVVEYLMNLANSDFEEWRKANPDKGYTEFELTFKRLSASGGPLFDEAKLRDISREIISKMTAEELYKNLLSWSSIYDKEFYNILTENSEYWVKVFSIERGGDKVRKDIAVWSETKEQIAFFSEKFFQSPDLANLDSSLNEEEIRGIINEYSRTFSVNDSSEEWLAKIKNLAVNLGLAPDIKTFKKEPGKYKGHVGEVAKIIRFLLTGRTQTPDLYQIIKVLGAEECKKRLASAK